MCPTVATQPMENYRKLIFTLAALTKDEKPLLTHSFINVKMLNVAPLTVLIVPANETVKSQTFSSGLSVVMDRKKQSGSSFGSQPGGASRQDFDWPHPSEVN